MAEIDEVARQIDAIIAKFSEHWSLERMPVVAAEQLDSIESGRCQLGH
jgi:transcription termination factor NusB